MISCDFPTKPPPPLLDNFHAQHRARTQSPGHGASSLPCAIPSQDGLDDTAIAMPSEHKPLTLRGHAAVRHKKPSLQTAKYICFDLPPNPCPGTWRGTVNIMPHPLRPETSSTASNGPTLRTLPPSLEKTWMRQVRHPARTNASDAIISESSYPPSCSSIQQRPAAAFQRIAFPPVLLPRGFRAGAGSSP